MGCLVCQVDFRPNLWYGAAMAINYYSNPEPLQTKLYVIVRDDITHGQQLAQVGHAASWFGVHHPYAMFADQHICVLRVGGEHELLEAWRRSPRPKERFFEPDFGEAGEFGAFAAASTGEEFADLKLAGGPHRLPFYRRWLKRLFR